MIEALDWIALTVKQEAEGEAYEGKLAVAYTIVTRMKRRHLSASQVVLQPYQYSCWNTPSPTRRRLDVDMTDPIWIASYRAASEALDERVPDPTNGCSSYLNPEACSPAQLKNAGYTNAAVRIILGKHHFFEPA